MELVSLPADRDELKLLYSMGWEAANIHLGSPISSRKVRRHVGKMKGNWLLVAVRKMMTAVNEDWKEWRKSKPYGRQAPAN